ncbi:MAG: hypothetical protein ACLFM2_08185 [Halothece sp.]
MAINGKTFMDAGLKGKIDSFYAPATIALLINDSGGDLNEGSSMTAVASKELPDGNGYERKQVTLPSATIENTNPRQATATSEEITFTASGGNIPEFTHIAFVINGSTTVGSTDGIIDRVEPVNNGTPISLNDGESYKHSFIQSETGEYIES